MINKRLITNLDVLNEAYCYSKPFGFSRGMRGEIEAMQLCYLFWEQQAMTRMANQFVKRLSETNRKSLL